MRPTTPGQAPEAASEPVRASDERSRSSVPAVVHPRTGELLDLGAQPTDALAEAFLAIRDYEREVKGWRTAVEGELRNRHTSHGGKVLIAGDYEVHLQGGNESVWDADELETVLRALVDEGAVDPRELVGVIRHETTVSRTEANRVLDRLGGRARAAMETCRTWRRKGSGRLEVVPAVQLLPPNEEKA